VRFEPLLGVILSGHSTARTGSSKISAAVPGRVFEARFAQAHQVVGQGDLGALRPLGDLEGGEAVDVDGGRRLAHGLDHVHVVVAVEVRVDATLQADLGGAERFSSATRRVISSSSSR